MRSLSRWGGLLLLLGVTLGALAEPPSSLPGRKQDSKEPWDVFLGRSAHFAIGAQYRGLHPSHRVFVDPADLYRIVKEGELGNPRRLPESVRRLRPDITDVDALVLFEVKPDHDEGREQGRAQVTRYLTALNAVVEQNKKLSAGIGFEGSLFLDFEDGGALWRLSWRTPEPGVTVYRWSYRRKGPGATWKERAAQKEEALPQEEIEQHGELAERALRAAFGEGEWPVDFRGDVYLPVDCH